MLQSPLLRRFQFERLETRQPLTVSLSDALLGFPLSGTALVGDLDGNDTPDVFFVTSQGRLDVRLNRGLTETNSIHFESLTGNPTELPILASAAALGDLDGDGDLDAVLRTFADEFFQAINDGNGNFEVGRRPLDISVDLRRPAMRLVDIDNDQDADLVLTKSRNKIIVLLNERDQGMTLFAELETNASTELIHDFDRDGDLDILAGENLWLFEPARFMRNRREFQLVSGVTRAIGDFNGDGLDDVFEIHRTGVGIHFGNDTQEGGLFVYQTLSSPYYDVDSPWHSIKFDAYEVQGTSIRHVVAGDIDGDLDIDLIFGQATIADDSFLPNPNFILLNDGSGAFPEAQSFGIEFTRSMTLADFDADNDLDLFEVNSLPTLWLNANVPSDLEVRMYDNVQGVQNAQAVEYVVEVQNHGPEPAEQAEVLVELPDTDFADVTWTCQSATAICREPAGTGDITQSIDLPVGSSIVYSIQATIHPEATDSATASARIVAAGNAQDINPHNNSVVDSNWIRPIVAGPKVNAASVSPNQSFRFAFDSPIDSATITAESILIVGNTVGAIQPESTALQSENTLAVSLPALPVAEHVRFVVTEEIATVDGQPIDTSTWDFRIASAGSAYLTRTKESLFGDGTVEALGDVNGDRKLDVLVSSSGTTEVWFGDGLGSFMLSDHRLADVRRIHLADYDTDGDLDAITVNRDYEVEVWKNHGDGSFARVSAGGFGRSSRVKAADLDHDGDLDLLVDERLFRNLGNDRFEATGQEVPTAYESIFGDVDGDGDLDILSSQGIVYRNDGSGVFDSGTYALLDSTENRRFHAAEFGDLDGDGDLDAYVIGALSLFDPFAGVWRNDGNGRFHVEVERGSFFDTPSGDDVFLRDMNGDGHLDAITPGHGVALNDGSGNFTDVRDDDGLGRYALFAGDVDGDGDVDVLSNGDVWSNAESSADLSVSINNGMDGLTAGASTTYSVVVRNESNTDAAGELNIVFSELLRDVSWQCEAFDLASCDDTNGANNIQQTVDLPAFSHIIFTVDTNVASTEGTATATAELTLVDSGLDSVFDNNRSVDSDVVRGWSVSPPRNSSHVPTDSELSFRAPFALDEASLTPASVQVTGEHSGQHDANYTFEDGSVTIVPTAPFLAGEQVTVTVNTRVRLADGNSIPQGFSWRFHIATKKQDPRLVNNPKPAGGTLAFGDADGDGDVDGWSREGVLINDGSGSFELRTIWGTNLTRYVNKGDIDGDGDLDAIVVHSLGSSGARTEIWANDGDANFTRRDNNFADFDIWRTEFVDLDLDGTLDLITAGETDETTVWRNDGSGLFSAVASGIDTVHTDIAIGDIDGDGDADLIGTAAREVGVWFNVGELRFEPGQPLGSRTNSVALLDADNDGDLDAIARTVWINQGGGIFQPTDQGHLRISNFHEWGIGDFDGDSDLDLFGSVVHTNVDGSFQHSRPQSATTSRVGPLADVDNDGDLDTANSLNVPRTAGDVNYDGAVNFADFLVLSCEFTNQRSCRSNSDVLSSDFDDDGNVSFADFLVLSHNFEEP